ncbi:MAG: RadC family protein [Oscillospiraceae bacterium]|nr:RadC family protein [Oscillospiraceae bacterium]
MSNRSIHDGHRGRLRERFLAEGLDNFTDVQVLELLLFYCIPRQDTNALAHELLRQFGSLSQVLETSVEGLKTVKGIGENAATFLRLIPAVTRYYAVDRGMRNDAPLLTTEDVGKYLLGYFQGQSNETVYLLCLDAKCKPLCCPKIGEGSVNSAGVPVRRVVEAALSANATSVVLAHNHPSGIALPSKEDILTTRRVAAALDAVEVTLADHLVVADGDFVSMLQSGYYRHNECRIGF